MWQHGNFYCISSVQVMPSSKVGPCGKVVTLGTAVLVPQSISEITFKSNFGISNLLGLCHLFSEVWRATHFFSRSLIVFINLPIADLYPLERRVSTSLKLVPNVMFSLKTETGL